MHFTPKTFEDKLISKYRSQVEGNMFLEVPIGNDKDIWPKGSKTRRVDCIRVLNNSKDIYRYNDLEIFKDCIKDKHIELIEAKKRLNRLVIGQVIVGIDMFIKQYKNKNVKGVILCEVGDPGLEIVCKERDVDVIII